MKTPVYDFIGVGIGPFNLGLAALCDDIAPLNCLFFEQNKSFGWHEGMLIKGTSLQVPFYADLVTLAAPESKFSYLSFLQRTGRLFRFAIRENPYPTRLEYNLYCKWVVSQLNTLHFGSKVIKISYAEKEKLYQVEVQNTFENILQTYYCKRIVLGIGSVPSIPTCIRKPLNKKIIHSSQYCFNKNKIQNAKSVCVIGSGQSGAEIFYDLLPSYKLFKKGLYWITRSERFFPMDFSKFSLEMTSPDYINFFYSLPLSVKDRLSASQQSLFKGINHTLIEAIYDYLYIESLEKKITGIHMRNNTALKNVTESDTSLTLNFHHRLTSKDYEIEADFIILATGYKTEIPSFIDALVSKIAFDEKGRYAVNKNYSIDKNGNEIFVQNAELHTHGFNAADLGMGPYRNAIILNTILGYQHFCNEDNIAFQQF